MYQPHEVSKFHVSHQDVERWSLGEDLYLALLEIERKIATAVKNNLLAGRTDINELMTEGIAVQIPSIAVDDSGKVKNKLVSALNAIDGGHHYYYDIILIDKNLEYGYNARVILLE